MNESKKQRLEKKGWRFGGAEEFLELSPEESEFIELKLTLGNAFKSRREQQGLSQVEAARRIQSSQSRVAKLETGDHSVSMDLLIRALFALGITPKELGRIVASLHSQ